jgi:L-ascorbate 6-phosphate lactonase
MLELSHRILSATKGQTWLFYIGQAGFVIKSASGLLVGIDLYLSDCCEREYGFKRLMPKILSPEDLIFDYILTSHFHRDHFDIDAVPFLMRNRQTKLIGTYDTVDDIRFLRLLEENVMLVRTGDTVSMSGITVEAVFCDHGNTAPQAVGFVIQVDGRKLYFTGDTSLRMDKADEILAKGPFDVMVLPINGAFGNLDERQAVEWCSAIRPCLCIPSHYWCFAEHYGSPGIFQNEIQEKLSDQKYYIMSICEGISI